MDKKAAHLGDVAGAEEVGLVDLVQLEVDDPERFSGKFWTERTNLKRGHFSAT